MLIHLLLHICLPYNCPLKSQFATLTSNSATQHSDIYRGNSTLTLFDLICLWISYRRALGLDDVKFARLPENRSITGLSQLFSFHPLHQNYRLNGITSFPLKSFFIPLLFLLMIFLFYSSMHSYR